MVYNWTTILQRLLYPPTCLLCGADGGGGMDLCAGCLRDLPHNHTPCSRCALPLPAGSGSFAVCGECQREPPAFDRCHAPFAYADPVPHLTGGLKFQGRLLNARLLGTLLGDYLERRELALPELLLPVPLHPRRLRERGYNQALEIARPLARRFAIPLELRACIRVRATAPQSELEKGERRRNVRGAFALAGPIAARHIALVDDVVTTGNTVSELARLLKRNGVEQVDVWALARTP